MYYNGCMISGRQKDQLASYFAAQPVDVVYVFGSQATGKTTNLSDVDIAVLFREGVSKDVRFDLRIQYIEDIGKLVGFADKVDVVDLELAPVLLRYSVIFPRQVVFCRDRLRQVVFEAGVMSRYFDEVYFLKQNTQYSLPSIARI